MARAGMFFAAGICAAAGLSGTVRDMAGKGVAGAVVTAQMTPGGKAYETKSGAEGEWRLDSLPGGKAAVTILFSGAGIRIEDVAITDMKTELPPVILQPSICGNGEFTAEFLRLKAGGEGVVEVEGRVMENRSDGPLSDAKIDVADQAGHVLTVRTDSSGRFRFAAKQGFYSMHVQKERYYDEKGSIILQQGYAVALSPVRLHRCGWFGFACDPASKPVCQ